jgi:hypothetical protein
MSHAVSKTVTDRRELFGFHEITHNENLGHEFDFAAKKCRFAELGV